MAKPTARCKKASTLYMTCTALENAKLDLDLSLDWFNIKACKILFKY